MNDYSYDMRDDASLVRAACDGNDSAFAALIDHYRPLVLGVAWAALQDFDDAEDAAQEAFIQAYRHLHSLKDPARFAAWLSKIATNNARKRLTHRALEAFRLRHGDMSAVQQPEDDAAYSPEMVRAAFSALSIPDRATATLFYLVGLPQDHIAELLGISVGTVKSRLHRSRRHLHRRLLDMAKQTFNEGECLVTGEAPWNDYELALLITPLAGGNAQVLVRMSEDLKCWYLIDLMLGWQAIQVCRVDLRSGGSGLERLSVVNCPIATGQEYDLMVAARGASITTYLDGKLMNQVTDFTYASGPVGLSVWQSKTAFRDPRIRLLS